MFSMQTENEIANNLCTATYGGPVMLTAHAYTELLTAARMFDAQRMGVGASRGYVMDFGGTAIRLETMQDGSIKPTAL